MAYSFERAVRLDKSPAFILTQFGLTKDNVNEKAKAVDDTTFVFTVDKPYAPSFVLNCLTATVTAVVDKKLLEEHAEKVTPTDDYKYDTDYANAWLKTKSAGSGPFTIREWRANEVVILERNDNFYGEKAKLKRVFYRHVKESATQRLMLESGDVDVARNLEPGDYEAVLKNDKLTTASAAKGTVYYISLNQKNEKPPSRKFAKRSNIWSIMMQSVRPSSRASVKSARPIRQRAFLVLSMLHPTSSTSPRRRNCSPRQA